MRTHRTVLGAAVLVALLVTGCRADHGESYDGGCSTSPSYRSDVLALDATSAAVLWRRDLTHPRERAPEVSEGHLLLRGCGAVVLDLADGSRLARRQQEDGDLLGIAGDRWVTTDGGDVQAVPWAGGGGFVGGSTPEWQDVALVGHLLLAGEAGSLVAMDVVRGGERWRSPLPTAGDTDQLLVGDVLVLRADDGSVYLLDAASGAVVWRALPGGSELGYGRLLAAGPGTAVVTAGGAAPDRFGPTTLVGLDLATGAERWRRAVPLAPSSGPPAVVDGTLVVVTPHGVSGLELATGHDRWTLAAASYAPVATADAVVVDDAASAVALDPVTGQVRWRRATGHRPLLGADPAGDVVVVLDSPAVPHGRNDCC